MLSLEKVWEMTRKWMASNNLSHALGTSVGGTTLSCGYIYKPCDDIEKLRLGVESLFIIRCGKLHANFPLELKVQ